VGVVAAGRLIPDNPLTVAVLLNSLREAGEHEQVAALLAQDPAAHAALDDMGAVAFLLDSLRRAGAHEQAAALASRAAAHAPLDDPLRVASLLGILRRAGAHDQAAALLARDPAAHASLDRPAGVARLLGSLREAGAHDQAAALLARDPAAHASLDRPAEVASLLGSLREAGAHDQVAALLARDLAAHAPLDRPAAFAPRDRPSAFALRPVRVPGWVPPARPRHLVGQCPESVAVGKPFSLLASINVAASPASAELALFDVPLEGQDVVLVMYAPALRVLSDDQQIVHVPAYADSRPVRFELRADAPGPAKVSITAWIGGTHLGELRVEITAERDRAPGPHREVLAEITTQPTAGAVSLVVRYDPSQQAYRFEFRDEDNPNEVHSNLAYDPGRSWSSS
jgi:hypothetical protein